MVSAKLQTSSNGLAPAAFLNNHQQRPSLSDEKRQHYCNFEQSAEVCDIRRGKHKNMRERDGSRRILFSASREFKSYHEGRTRIHLRLSRHCDAALKIIPDNVSKKLFTLRRGWKIFDFRDNDWLAISSIRNATESVQLTYYYMLIEYVIANADRVRSIQSVYDTYNAILLGSSERPEASAPTLDDLDRQCLFVFKLNGYLKASTGKQSFIDYLRDRANSKWVKTRLLYPMVYHTINVPTDDYIDTFLSYMMPQDNTGGIERITARHVLRDDLSFNESSGFRAYVGLMSHPFDALESITNDIEIAFCKTSSLTEHLAYALETLSNEFPDSRISRIRDQLANYKAPPTTGWPSWNSTSSIPVKLRPIIDAIVSLDAEIPAIDSLPTEEWKAICRMRWSRYPEGKDFEHVQREVRALRFLEAGQVFASLMTSMYMHRRQPELLERRHLMRLHRFAGRTTPYLWASPRGYWLMQNQLSAGGSWLGADLRAGVELDRCLKAGSRPWIHAVHWRLGKAERQAKVREWLELIRSNFPVRPQYLTGIDWGWVEEILPVVRITPFRSSPSGPYALLLRSIEENEQDSTQLRTAIEPLRGSLTCGEFVSLLEREYGNDSVAFVRYFLTPENIMLLGMAPNMTAALSERIAALEQCATTFGFGELLTEDQLKQEQETLTSALMLLSVNANQFDIPWASFSRDVTNRHRDTFDIYYALNNSNRTLSIVNDTNIIYGHNYKNGRKETYDLKSSNNVLATVILGVIDTFLDHPSYGIEAILSTRFRHDTLRREFVFAFDEVKRSHIQGIVPHDQVEIVEGLSEAALDELDYWLFRYMQTVRPGAEDALFDFVPSGEELGKLMDSVNPDSNIETIIGTVIDWIIPRLDAQLATARFQFVERFVPAAQGAVLERSLDLGATTMVNDLVLARLTTIVSDAVRRRASDLLEWFRVPSSGSQPSLTFDQIAAAVIGRFETLISDGRLSVTRSMADLFNRPFKPEQVRLAFDLLSEVIHNAGKYSGLDRCRMRLRHYQEIGSWGVICSSSAALDSEAQYEADGHPYVSLTDALFREGNSGLAKIGALSASIIGAPCKIKAVRRMRSFHIKIPLGCDLP